MSLVAALLDYGKRLYLYLKMALYTTTNVEYIWFMYFIFRSNVFHSVFLFYIYLSFSLTIFGCSVKSIAIRITVAQLQEKQKMKKKLFNWINSVTKARVTQYDFFSSIEIKNNKLPNLMRA